MIFVDLERRFTASTVVAIWGTMNFLLAALLVGYILGGFGGHLFEAAIYGGGVLIVFTIALATWLARRRNPSWRGLRTTRRPAVVLLVAVGFALLWLGLPFGIWLPMSSAAPFLAALLLQVYPDSH